VSADRKQPGVAFWATVVMVAVLLYLLSFIPAGYAVDFLIDAGILSDDAWYVFAVAYFPIIWFDKGRST
jgi:amino acid transporter